MTAACGLGTAALWMAANNDGQHLLATGETRGLFAGQVFPARIMLRYDGIDPLGVCRSRREAILVGGNDRVAYVLLRQARSDRPSPDLPLVVPLPYESYVVTTGVAAPRPVRRPAIDASHGGRGRRPAPRRGRRRR